MQRETVLSAGLLAGCALLIAASSTASAQEPTAPTGCEPPQEPLSQTPSDAARPPSVVTNPRWLSVPSPGTMALLYPTKAVRDHVAGFALVECKIQLDHTLTNCTVLEETPPRYGFGEATVRFLRKARMAPRTVDGVPCAGSTVRYPMQWRLG
jgi:TonB family protein